MEDIFPGHTVRVRTSKASYEANKIVITAGPWAQSLLKPLGLNLPLVVRSILFFESVSLDIKDPMKSNVPYLTFAILLSIICKIYKHVFIITNSMSTNKGKLIQP